MSARRDGPPRPSPDEAAAESGGKRARRSSAEELQHRLLRSLDANLAAPLRTPAAVPRFAERAPPAEPLAPRAPSPPPAPAAPPRALPARSFYAATGSRGERADAVVEEWLQSLSARAVQRAQAAREPHAHAFATQAESFDWADARTAEVRPPLRTPLPPSRLTRVCVFALRAACRRAARRRAPHDALFARGRRDRPPLLRRSARRSAVAAVQSAAVRCATPL
jgi:hypothetical protein